MVDDSFIFLLGELIIGWNLVYFFVYCKIVGYVMMVIIDGEKNYELMILVCLWIIFSDVCNYK